MTPDLVLAGLFLSCSAIALGFLAGFIVGIETAQRRVKR